MKVEWNGYRLTGNELQALLALTDGELTGLQIGTGSTDELKKGLLLLQEKGLLFHSEEGEMLERVIAFVVHELGESSRCVLYETEQENVLAGLYCCQHMWIFLCRRQEGWQLFPMQKLKEALRVLREYEKCSEAHGLYYLVDEQLHVLDGRNDEQELTAFLEKWARRNG